MLQHMDHIEASFVLYVNVSMLHRLEQRKICVLTVTKVGIAISNNSSFRQKHPGFPDGSDGSEGTSYPLTENYTLPVAQATGRVA